MIKVYNNLNKCDTDALAEGLVNLIFKSRLDYVKEKGIALALKYQELLYPIDSKKRELLDSEGTEDKFYYSKHKKFVATNLS